MQDKVSLLMEEVGCDRGEAELALASAGYNLEKAIRMIGVLLRNIIVIKAKFFVPQANIYGLFIIITNIKRKSVLRLRAVVSHNPSLFESDIDIDWYDFERRIYGSRLAEGISQKRTQSLEQFLYGSLQTEAEKQFYSHMESGGISILNEQLGSILKKFFHDDVRLKMLHEEINLEQYRQLKRDGGSQLISTAIQPNSAEESEMIVVDIDVLEDQKGTHAEHIHQGDSIYAIFVDTRDIAQYLAKLLGGRSGDNLTPLIAPVEEIRKERNQVILNVRLAPRIVGIARVSGTKKVKLHKRKKQIWWKRWLGLWDEE